MAKSKEIELGDGTLIPIIYEDRSVLAIDKPAGWMLAPESWDRTGRNLNLALISSIQGRDYWAQSRNLKFLRFVHRLDAETTGVLLLAKNMGALRALSELFENDRVEKVYLAAVDGIPGKPEWISQQALEPDPGMSGRMRVATGKWNAAAEGPQPKSAETHFRVLQTGSDKALVEARPLTGRTHQIRVHLAAAGCPVAGDPLYGRRPGRKPGRVEAIGLRAVRMEYVDPFTKRKVWIEAPAETFAREYGFRLG
jgi:RluA family pseudouridine synthase